jgi:hypothetical protein
MSDIKLFTQALGSSQFIMQSTIAKTPQELMEYLASKKTHVTLPEARAISAVLKKCKNRGNVSLADAAEILSGNAGPAPKAKPSTSSTTSNSNAKLAAAAKKCAAASASLCEAISRVSVSPQQKKQAPVKKDTPVTAPVKKAVASR